MGHGQEKTPKRTRSKVPCSPAKSPKKVCSDVQEEAVLLATDHSGSSSESQLLVPSSEEPVTTFHCLWKSCNESFKDADGLHYHFKEHNGNGQLACEWNGCEFHGRPTRDVNQLLKHLRRNHIPPDAFPCSLTGCSRLFPTLEEQTSHVVKCKPRKQVPHHRFASAGKLSNDFLTERITNIDFILPHIRRALNAREALGSIGITYVGISGGEYFISVHGIPEGSTVEATTGLEQRYRLHFPFAPNWIRPAHIQTVLAPSVKSNCIPVWKLPLSNALFLQPLRKFITETEKRFTNL